MRWFALKKTPANTDYLSSLRIAAPCKASWDSMEGDNRVRLCGQCDKNVYDISKMTRDEANEFLRLTAYGACVKFYQRSDGTIITDNCPVGLRKLRAHCRRVAAAVTTAFSLAQGFLLAGFAGDSDESKSSSSAATVLQGQPLIQPDPRRISPRALTGKPKLTGSLAPRKSIMVAMYRERAEALVADVLPKNVDFGKAAISLEVDTDGSIKSSQLIHGSPTKELNDLILKSVGNLKLDKLPADYSQFSGSNTMRLYFECSRVMGAQKALPQ